MSIQKDSISRFQKIFIFNDLIAIGGAMKYIDLIIKNVVKSRRSISSGIA